MREMPMRERPLGRWAFWSSIASVLMLAGWFVLLLLTLKYLDVGLPSFYAALGWVVVPGFLIAAVSTFVLSVRALALLRQPRCAAAALLILVLPVPVYIVIRAVGNAAG